MSLGIILDLHQTVNLVPLSPSPEPLNLWPNLARTPGVGEERGRATWSRPSEEGENLPQMNSLKDRQCKY
jgi:hypothetical protein